MKLRTILAASTALSLVAAAPGASASELYLSVFGGMNLLSDTDGQYVSTFSSSTSSSSVIGSWASDADTGFVVGGAVGTSLDKWVNGLRVEAGAQGEHKLARGYLPVPVHSLHYIPDPGFRKAIARYLDQERRAVDEQIEEMTAYGPFRKAAPPEPEQD